MPFERSRSRVLAAVAALGLMTTPVTSASADGHDQGPALLQCQGTESVAYSPGFTFQPRPFQVTTEGRFVSCVDAGGKVKSGTYGESFSLFAGCDDLLDGFTGRRTFRWSTGDASVAEIGGDSTAVAGQVVTTITGKVVEGRFEGRTVVEIIALPQPNALQCLTTGFTGATGVTTLTIT
ncbi:hypothetical protein GCM10010218_38100 [Streptomyces mashuensis]|uniref:Secreted protein n=1 Tax=Streptomyces mashuensis TaxID=33904 RepID=A0A919B4B3_9ACTN|nr:hypothetical protein [Streptomyces mashuensis]GHF53023.1 hypothetical protein GCM10010218_38100 [Streptomyces mashuensis]